MTFYEVIGKCDVPVTKYREKYERATIWEYTGGEPHGGDSVKGEGESV